MLCLAAAPTAQATSTAADMTAGVWTGNPRYMSFGYFNERPLVWRVLEVKDENPDFGGTKTAFLLLDDVLRHSGNFAKTMRFGHPNNSFPNSDIKNWLNDCEDGFLTVLAAYQANILDTTYRPGNHNHRWAGGPAEDTSKVFLLSVDEAIDNKYFANNADRVASRIIWWLRSPGFENDIVTVVFSPGFVARNGSYIEAMHAVRPALKIDISPSSVFADLPVSYGLAVRAVDENNSIRGAKFSLRDADDTYEKSPVENFSNSLGIARFTRVVPGTYTLTVSKPGYKTESLSISVPTAEIPVVSLIPNPEAFPDRVNFGHYEGKPIEWDVLDIVDGRALLFAGALFEKIRFDNQGSNVWANSTMREFLNSDADGDPIVGFLHEINFTAADIAAMDVAASPTGDAVFLLSTEEVFHYLPDADMRLIADELATWLTRSPVGTEDLAAICPSGEYTVFYVLDRASSGWTRPATWVDLSLLTYDRDTNTLSGIEE